MGQDSRSVILRYVAALQAGDAETVRDSFAEDATWWLGGDLPVSGTWAGRDAILGEFLGQVRELFEPGWTSIEVRGLIAEGERVALEWTTRGRTAAGADYENEYAAVFVLRDGRIAEVREYTDTQLAARVLFAAADRM
jgi:uncharacterized protein (TIGR02246 family)